MRTVIFVWLLFVSNSVLSKTVEVEIFKKKYSPTEITIEQGDTAIWKNIEKRQYHNVWFKQLDQAEPDYLFPDESYQRRFDNLGEFLYECGPHPRMKGKVIVIEKYLKRL